MIRVPENTPLGTKVFVNGREVKGVVRVVTFCFIGVVEHLMYDCEGDPLINIAENDFVRTRTWGFVWLKYPREANA